MKYTKQPIDIPSQLDMLKQRGLIFRNEDIEYLDWDSLTDCYEFYNGTVRINMEKGNNIATIKYNDMEIDY